MKTELNLTFPILALIIFFALKHFFGKDKPKADDPIVVSPEDGEVTITTIQASEYADALEDAFNYPSLDGTNEEALSSILSVLQNKYDFALVNQTFGLRKYWLGGTSSTFGTKLNLKGWVKEELDESHQVYQTFKFKFKEIGINLI